jgi:hypothetical protein
MLHLTPPAMPGLPILGNLLAFNRDPYGLLQRGYDTLGPIFSLRLGPKRAAVLIGPHYHQRFFEETDHTLSMAQAYKFLVPMFGEPVGVTAAPEDYQKQRAIFLELFKSANMEGYVQVMVQEVQAWLATLGDSGTFEVVDGGVSNVDIDGDETLQIKGIWVAISTFETLPSTPGATYCRACLSGGRVSAALGRTLLAPVSRPRGRHGCGVAPVSSAPAFSPARPRQTPNARHAPAVDC